MNTPHDIEDPNPAQSDTAAVEDSTPSIKSKKRKWLRRLVWFIVVVGILAYFVNGLIARKVVHHFLNKSLEDQGMTGSVEIQGTILGGLSVHDLDYSGKEGIQELSIDQTSVNYKIQDVIKGKIDSLKVDKIRAKIDIAKFKPKPPTDKPEKDIKETLRSLRPLILQPEITISDLDLTVLNNGKKIAEWKLKSLQHDAGTDEIKLNQWIASNGAGITLPAQDAVIGWLQNGATLDRLEIVPDLALKEIQLDWKTSLSGNSTIALNDAIITANIAENATIKLESGEMVSAEILKTLKSLGIELPELDGEAVISDLQITIPTNDLSLAVPEWNIDGLLLLKSGRWETFNLKDTKLSIKQFDKNYEVKLDATALNAPVMLNAKGTWAAIPDPTWWDDTIVSLDFNVQASKEILALIPDDVTLPQGIRIGQTSVEGSIKTSLANGRPGLTKARVELSGVSFEKHPLPNILIESTLENERDVSLEFTLIPENTNKNAKFFKIDGKYNIDTQKYSGDLELLAEIKNHAWFYPLTESLNLPVTLQDKIDIQWSGSGDLLNDEHTGKLAVRDLLAKQPGQAVIRLNTQTNYDWPKSLDIAQLTIEQEELVVSASLIWNGKEVNIRDSNLKRDGESIGSINGKIPYTSDIINAKQFFAQEIPWVLSIETEKLRLEKIASLIPAGKMPDLKGSLQTNMKLSGTPKNPAINGIIDIDKMNDIFDLGLGEISIDSKFKTEQQLLKVNGDILENNEKRVTLNLELPFTPHQWLEDDNLLATIKKNSKLKGVAEIKRLPLGKFKKLIPQVEKLEGMLDAKAVFKGSIDKPEYTIDFNADLPIIRLKDAGIDDIKNLNIKGQLDQNMIAKGDLTAKLNGGKFITKFNIDVNDPEKPVFDVNLITDHALIYRNDVLATRTNANITLKGTLEDATISGDIGIVESLFYKDIDLIPIGVPSSAVGAVKLPSIDTKKSDKLPIPAPFDKWKLNVLVKTTDPILIKGNIGNGNIKGSVKVNGTLSDPSLKGTLRTNKVRAKLPFSVLTVSNGKIIFKPGQGFIPSLEIKGKSQVGVHNVNLYVYGSADSPKIVLSSLPALPENEIMTLLATGTTNAGLENRDVATFKTLQILLLELKQRNDRPGGNRLFSKILSGIDDLDLKVGEVNELTGEKYASARIKLHDRWYLTAQLDNGQPPQTRGLLTFALRFN